MPTREELQEAYVAFRLPAGTDWKTIKKRYKLLVKAWHPDKQGGQGKEEVEQELKEYNHFYNDIFKIHFESEHSDGPHCSCQLSEEAPRADEQDDFRQPENQFYQGNESSKPVEVIDPVVVARSELRRRQASILSAVVFIAILVYGFIGSKIRSIVPVQKTAVQNTQPEQASISTPTPATNNSGWRAPYQSISAPITQQQPQPQSSLVNQNTDEIRREIVSKETKMQMLQQGIDTLKAQIKVAQPATAGMLYRDLGSKEAEIQSLRQAVFNLRHSIGEN